MSGILNAMFFGGGGGGAIITSREIIAMVTSYGGACSASYMLNSDGTASGNADILSGTGFTSGDGTYNGEWLQYGSAADYDVYATLTPGSDSAFGSFNTWVNLSTDPGWGLAAWNSDLSAEIVLQIARTTSRTSVITSATILIEANGAGTL
jgi:hypothetical protein